MNPERRVVITGRGGITSIGSNIETMTAFLKNGMSGLGINNSYRVAGLQSHVSGTLLDPIATIESSIEGGKKITRFMSPGAAHGYLSMIQALEESQLTKEMLTSHRTGLIIGSGGGSPESCIEVGKKLDKGEYRKISPRASAQCMTSSASANLATLFGIRGISYTPSSACATGAHAIGEAYEKILFGKLDIAICGGCEEESSSIAATFDRAKALSTNFNDTPPKASRPYDKDRDGFVISGGGGIIIIEELEHALNRGAHIIAEIIGYGATSDGYDMTKPSGEGAEMCMKMALACAPEIFPEHVQYINPHGTSTLVGDIVELRAIERVFGDKSPLISSTKGLSGHGLGAAGAQELIYCTIMMEHGFIAGSANIENIDPVAKNFRIVRETMETPVDVVMSNSFGFGGTNASLLLRK